jgi:hypothetical protein
VAQRSPRKRVGVSESVPQPSLRFELLEVLTIGLPFCGFKVLAGLSLAGALGMVLVALGVIDALINLINLVGLLILRRRPLSACLFAVVLSWRRPLHTWRDLGNSVDVLLSFSLVAFMIAASRLGSLSTQQLAVWNACVILNVLGAGLGRFGQSLRNVRTPLHPDRG